MNHSLRPFERSLPMALMRAREAVMREFRPRLAKHDLTEQQWRVLRALDAQKAPLTTRELSEITFLLGPSLSRITANLTARGLLNRNANPSDRRSSLLSLSQKGKILLSAAATESESGYRAIEEGFGQDRLEILHGLLDDLAATRTTKDT